MSNGYRTEAPAKINLGLRVGPQDDEGYHRIRTVFQTISLTDQLRFRVSDSGRDELTVAGPISVPSNSDNLILLTLKRARERGLPVPPLTIELTKNIPVESGLGGGSSNAAATLSALDYFLEESVGYDRLVEVARGIGADVPFFLQGGTMLGTGRGDRLKQLPPLRGKGILAVPPYGVSTEWAYRNIEPRSEAELEGIIETSETELETWEELDLTNDFEPLILDAHPEHRDIQGTLTEVSSSTALTGSGSAHYALVNPGSGYADSIDRLSRKHEECRWFEFEFIPCV